MIRYLIKFVSEEAYAEDLLSGKLFMHCAKYYHDLEKEYGPGYGDQREGTIFPNTAIYQNIYDPIYCMYMITVEDIVDGQVLIDKRVIRDFTRGHGYLVIVPFDSFEKALTTCDTNGYEMKGREVWYGNPAQNDIDNLFKSKNALNLIVKNPYSRYQKEFRIIVFKNLYQDGFPESLNEERYFICRLSNPIRGFAKKMPTSSLQETENGFLLNLRDVFGNCELI